MAFRINQNIPAIQVHRNLSKNNQDLQSSLEHISSGTRINRASDGPAALTISEQMRSQIGGLNQAIDNSEAAVSMMQTTEASMEEISASLLHMRQLALHAANEGINDIAALEADQREFESELQTIDRIADQAQFGNDKLLDGSKGVTGTVSGDNLEFLEATAATGDSRYKGLEVAVSRVATRTHLQGTELLTDEIVEAGEELTVMEEGRIATYVTKSDDTVESAMLNLQIVMDRNGIQIEAFVDDTGRMSLRHRKYGSDHKFQAMSSTSGILSEIGGTIKNADVGQDIVGTINGEFTIGKGQIMEGVPGSDCIEGLRVRYAGTDEDLLDAECVVNDKFVENGGYAEPGDFPEEGRSVGRVYVMQNAVRFQVGSSLDHIATIAIGNMKTDHLGRNIPNLSGFEHLADVNLRNFQGTQDAIKLIDTALAKVSNDRANLGAFQKNTLENNLSNLRVANENLISSESIIRDSDMAAEMAAYMKNKIKANSAAAMMVQANQKSENVRELLG